MARGDDPTRPGARHRADGRLVRARCRTRAISPPPPGPSCAPPPRTPPRSTCSSSCSTAPSGPPSSSAPERTSSAPGTRSSRSRSGSTRRSGRSRSAPGPGSRRTTRASRGTCPRTGRGSARVLEPFDAVLVVGRAGVPPVRVRTGAVPRPGHARRGRDRRPRRGAPQRRGARRARPRRPDVRGARRAARAARRTTSDRHRVRASARAGRDGRPAHVRVRLLCARAAPASRRDRARGGAVQQARAARADRGARPARVPEPRDGRARVRDPGGDRDPDGPPGASGARDRRRRVLAVRDPGALDRGALRGRGSVRDPRQRGLRGDGSPRRAPRRHRPSGPGSPTSTSPGSRAPSAARPAG